MGKETERTQHADAVQQMVKFFEVLVKDHKELQEYGFADVIPLLSESYFTGETNDEAVDEVLNSIDSEALRKQFKDKLIEIKIKVNKKNNVALEKEKQAPALIGKEPTKQIKQKGKIFERIEQAPKVEPTRKKVKVQKDKQVTPKDEKKAEDQMEMENGEQIKKDGLKKELERQGKQKCRFFPFCKNEQTCEYFHPTQKVQIFKMPCQRIKKIHLDLHLKNNSKKQIKKLKIIKKCRLRKGESIRKNKLFFDMLSQCKYFPNCKHGDNCLYVHEACRFSQNCNKPACPYVHPFKKNGNILQQVLKGYLQSHNHPFKSKRKPNKSNPNQGQPQAKSEDN